MEVQNSKAYLGVRFCSSNEQDLLMNQGKKHGHAEEDTEENCETVLRDVLTLDDRISNQQTQHFQIDNELIRENTEKEKSFVDKYGASDFSKQGLYQISSQLLPRLATVQMLYLQVTFLKLNHSFWEFWDN